MEKIKLLLAELDKVVIGYRNEKLKIVFALLADGHVLLESVPGLAKTTLIAALQVAISNSTKNRIQMTPDLKPGDIVGTLVFNPKTGDFEIKTGPIIGINFLLADEINRATPKAQSALLEAMQERKVTIAGTSFTLKDPFLVLATMNPIEQEGTYPLPEAQLDRFAMKVTLDYVSREDEIKILQNTGVHGRNATDKVTPVISTDEIIALRQDILGNVAVSRSAAEYIVDLVRTTRRGDPNFKKYLPAEIQAQVEMGASPRAEIWLQRLSQVKAYLSGRKFVTPEDVKWVARDVMRHRILLTQEALADKSLSTDAVIAHALDKVPVIEPKSK